jgi:hypothetical protein
MIAALRGGASLGIGVDHDHYRHAVEAVTEATRKALIADFP